MSIGLRIRKRRQEKQYTLEEIANKIGTSRQTLSKYETGKIEGIPSEKIELLAKALDTSPAYLMGWEEESSTSEKIEPNMDYYLLNKENKATIDNLIAALLKAQSEN